MNTNTDNSVASQLASEISARIANLEKLFDEPLKEEMGQLKACLIENPSAAALLKSQDIGLLVQSLRRTVSSAIIAANSAKERKPSAAKKAAAKRPLTAEEMKAALDDGFPE